MDHIRKLIFYVSEILQDSQSPLGEKELKNLIDIQSQVFAIKDANVKFTPEQLQDAFDQIQKQFVTRMELGTIFHAEEYRPWLSGAQADIDWYYWNRYRKQLRRKGISESVVRTLDSVTDEILNHLENPKKEGQWRRQGLVVGNVQSGKTANFTGLISKAADAGYKVIIVLAGTLNSLRSQTQERLDSDFIGYCRFKNNFIGAGLLHDAQKGKPRRPVCFTTVNDDFKKMAANVTMGLESLNEPAIFVLKKNTSTLKNLHDWLSGNNRTDLKDFPMLLVDDEADHASVNTNKQEDDPTTINRWIRDILKLFPRCSFVGYTATPFANIFIAPESDEEMTNGDIYRDLFPRDFIYSLDAPTNYVGASELFLDEGKPSRLRRIEDHETYIPSKHKIDFDPAELAPSLKEAISAFILGKAVRLIRGHEGRHFSMMVNVSRFTSVQNRLKNLIMDHVKKVRDAVICYSTCPESEALQNGFIAELNQLWLKEFSQTENTTWSAIQAKLKDSIGPLEVISVNRESVTLDYSSRNYPSGRTVIAVGGLSLSRGITLEGLMCSYFLRNSIMYDTLMQMGRWFGYRDGYDDLCRIYMTDEAKSWYSHIADATEELRSDFKRMSVAQMTPMDFGLRVRSHPTALIVTARNKMRSSEEVVMQIDLEGRLAETSIVYADKLSTESNLKLLEETVAIASKLTAPTKETLGLVWKGVPNTVAKSLVGNFRNHPECYLTNKEPLLEYLEWLEKEKGQKTIDVLLRSAAKNESGDFESIAGHRIYPMERTLVKPADSKAQPNRIEFTKRRVASRGDERAGLSEEEENECKAIYRAENPDKDVPDKAYRRYRQNHGYPPLLMIMFVRPKDSQGMPPLIPTYGIGFPGDPGEHKRPTKRVQYRVNTVWMKTIAELYPEEESE